MFVRREFKALQIYVSGAPAGADIVCFELTHCAVHVRLFVVYRPPSVSDATTLYLGTTIDVLNVKNIIKNVKKRVFFLANKKR